MKEIRVFLKRTTTTNLTSTYGKAFNLFRCVKKFNLRKILKSKFSGTIDVTGFGQLTVTLFTNPALFF